MPGIDPAVSCHELNVDTIYKPIKQKRRKLGLERVEAVNDKAQQVTAIRFISEVRYPDWLAKPVVIKKNIGNWRVCVYFTDLNKVFPKDSFLLPRIDQVAEAIAENKLMLFMDAFSGYNQIVMHPDDREKTAFITDKGT